MVIYSIDSTLKSWLRSEWQHGCEMNIKLNCDAVIIHHAKTDCERLTHPFLVEVTRSMLLYVISVSSLCINCDKTLDIIVMVQKRKA